MRHFLLLLLLTTTTVFTYANEITEPFSDRDGSPITMGCIAMALGVCALISGAIYLAITNNNRGGKRDNNA